MTGPSFLDTQRRFAAHLRDPQATAAPEDIEDRRMAIYRDLFWRNIEGFISNGFPVLRSLLSDGDWDALVRAFYAQHRCDSGYFADIPAEFLGWLNGGDYPRDGYPPFMAELAYYEWLELALSISTEEIPEQGVDAEGDLLQGQLLLSPLCALTGSHWPVHQIATDAVPSEPLPAPVWLLVWRDRADQVHFMELNAASARLIQLLEQGGDTSADTLLQTLASELGQDTHALQPFLTDILTQWRQQDILLGIRA
ncbi:MAG: putative DNA-binding domain-containing protein [Alcanivoracaceae bacterium]|nr:putative DNA-binding domain-containing protein [Alcanivoracaceae bacterium]